MQIPRKVLFLTTVLFLSPIPAAAQSSESSDTAPGSAALAASDAFGERVGLNAAGLYSDVQMRGFDLVASSGAFRLDGFYYYPAAGPSESLISGSTVNVGISATALDLPSPTGVIAYRLRDPGTYSSLSITSGLREQETKHLEVLGTLVTGDGTFGVVGHGIYAPKHDLEWGGDGAYLRLGGVGRWNVGPDTNVRLFGSYSKERYDGDISVLAADDGVPPPLRADRNYRADWMRSRTSGGNSGVLVAHRGGAWSFGASAIRSISHVDRSDVAVLEIDRDGLAISTIYHTPKVEKRSDSAEAKAAKVIRLFGAEHRLGLAIRQRTTTTGRALATASPGGSFDVEEGAGEATAPDLPEDAIRGRDKVNQRIVSATYDLAVGTRAELRLGVHRNRYLKTVHDFEGRHLRKLDNSWLYSASTIWRPADRWQIFASYVSGLEESGVAPAAAVNRGEVLPPVEARQYESGARFEITPQLNLIAAAFDIRKPIYGLRQDGLYAPVGKVRHRGIEGSLTGRITSNTTIVLGANLVDPTISGEQVAEGLIRKTAPGVSRFNATVSFEHALTPAWSIDGYLLYEGKRRRDSITRTQVGGVPFAFLGTRYDFVMRGTPLSLRAQLTNVLNRKGYYATPYGPLVPISPQTYRVMVTADF